MERNWQDYKALYKNIAGARNAFEKTCRILFKTKFKNENVKSIAVKQGDGGVDIFVGDLGVTPIKVFQCKFFIEGFGDSQKTQIKKSFNTAINSSKYKMSEWNLCIPNELDINNQSWWTAWKKNIEKKHSIPINLYDGNDLIDELKATNLYNTEFMIEEKLQLDRIEKAIIKKERTLIEKLLDDVKNWYSVLGYTLECFEQIDDSFFKIIINVKNRRGYDRIFVLGTIDEIELFHLETIKLDLLTHNCIEGWIVTYNRVSEVVKNTINKSPCNIFYYTLDEMIDKDIDLSEYFSWIEKEITDKKIDKQYINLSCKKDSLHPQTKQKIGESSIYNEKNGYIEGYINKWIDDPNKKHISILGEFGTGKTWFSLHYAWSLLKKYQNDKNNGTKRSRLPIYIPLRDYAKAVSIEALFSDFFFRKYNSPIPGYKAFELLNKMGKFVIILDGFDEMADKIDRQKMINNFWELAKIAVIENAKVILTCRNEHFPQAHEGRSLLNAELKASVSSLTGISPQFEVIELLKLNEEQIKSILNFYTNKKIIRKIIDNKTLLDLARRPLMVELIIESIPEIVQGKKIDISRIYLYAVSKKMRKDIKEERTFTSLSDKLYFMCELSWEMLSNDKMTINYKEFPDRIRSIFGDVVKEQKDLDHWQYDMMGQTLLIRNDDGDYKPAHRSLLEFFVAFKFAGELGLLPDDFANIAKENYSFDNNLPKQDYTWQEYFLKGGSAKNNAPLKSFKKSDHEYIVNTFGKFPLSKAILDLISSIIQLPETSTQNELLELLDFCRHKSTIEIKYLASNIVLLMVNFQYNFFRDKNLSYLTISDFKFPSLRKEEREEFSYIESKFADFSGCNFENSNLINSNFGNPAYSYINIEKSNFLNTNFKSTQLDNFYFPVSQVDSITYNPLTSEVIVGSPDELLILNSDFYVKKRLTTSAWHSKISPDNKFVVHSGFGNFVLRNLNNYDISKVVNLSNKINPNCSEKNNMWTGGFQFSSNSEIVYICCSNSFIYAYEISTETELFTLQCFTGVSDVTICPENKYLLSYGFDEFILWDLAKRKILYFERKKNKLISYVAKFHPVLKKFIVINETKVRVFNTETLVIEKEFFYENVKHVYFVEQRNLLLLSDSKKITIFDSFEFNEIESFNIANQLNQLNFIFNSFELITNSIDEILVQIINNELILFFVFSNKAVVKYNYDEKNIVDYYFHLIDFSNANFSMSTGVKMDILKQLNKNGAII